MPKRLLNDGSANHGYKENESVWQRRIQKDGGCREENGSNQTSLCRYGKEDGIRRSQTYGEEEVMPLKKSPTPAAFKANVRAEVKAGKPVKQAVAISYAVKRQAEKKK